MTNAVRVPGCGKAALWLFGACLLIPGRTAAQQPQGQNKAPSALQLTLREAVALALRQNPNVQISALDLAKSQENRKIAISALLPQASLGVSDRATRANIEANFGGPLPVPGFPKHIGPFQVFDAGTAFSMPVFDLALWRSLQAAGHAEAEASADRTGVREQVTLLVVSQYLSSLRAMADVQSAQSRVQLAQALYDQARDLQKHGVATGLDTLRADVELQNEQQVLIEAQTDEKTSLYALARLLNADPRTPIRLTDQMSFYQTPPYAAAQGIAEALANRPEMRAIEAEELRLESERRATNEQKLPTLSFDGQYVQEGISAATVIPTYVYAARISFPLFTGGRIRAEEASANLDLEVLAQRRIDLTNQIALEVRTAAARLDAARHEVDVARLGVELASEEVSQSRDRFRAGVTDNIEVVTAQDALARANNNQIGALYRYNEARAELARATGQIQEMYAR